MGDNATIIKNKNLDRTWTWRSESECDWNNKFYSFRRVLGTYQILTRMYTCKRGERERKKNARKIKWKLFVESCFFFLVDLNLFSDAKYVNQYCRMHEHAAPYI